MIEKENIFIRFLKFIGLIKEVPVSKNIMCEQAQNICNHNCESCAWKEEN